MLAFSAGALCACGGEPKRKVDQEEINQNADDLKRDMDRKN